MKAVDGRGGGGGGWREKGGWLIDWSARRNPSPRTGDNRVSSIKSRQRCEAVPCSGGPFIACHYKHTPAGKNAENVTAAARQNPKWWSITWTKVQSYVSVNRGSTSCRKVSLFWDGGDGDGRGKRRHMEHSTGVNLLSVAHRGATAEPSWAEPSRAEPSRAPLSKVPCRNVWWVSCSRTTALVCNYLEICLMCQLEAPFNNLTLSRLFSFFF